MLKWTVHKKLEPADATMTNESDHRDLIHSRRSFGNAPRSMVHRSHQTNRRKTLGPSEISKRINYRNKENQHVLTPHPYSFRTSVTSTPVSYGKSDSALRDVRNITPKNSNSIASLIELVTPSRKRPLAGSPSSPPKSPLIVLPENGSVAIAAFPATPAPYASTLPTFDVEYSPCGATIKPVMSSTINPISLTDSYFNQPRYFQDAMPASKRLKFSPSTVTPLSRRQQAFRKSKDTALSRTQTTEQSKVIESDKKAEGNVSNSGNNNNNNETSKNHNANGNSNNVSDNKNDNNNNSDNNSNSKSKRRDTNRVETVANMSDDSLSSSALNDTALDKMIDAILESARKEKSSLLRNFAPRKMHMAIGSNFNQVISDSPTYTAAEDPASDLNKFYDKFVISPEQLLEAGDRTIIIEETNEVNEREVKTPESDTKRFKHDDALQAVENSCHLRRQKGVRRKHAKLDLKLDPNISSVPSPKTPVDTDFVNSSFFKKSNEELANMNTPTIEADTEMKKMQQPDCDTKSITSKVSADSTPGIHTKDLQASSTPTNVCSSQAVSSIRRCLTFCDSPAGFAEDDYSMEKRKSTASSTASNSLLSFASGDAVSGSLDLVIFSENNKLNIHGESLV